MKQKSNVHIANLRNQAAARLPFCIPWSRTMQAVRLGTTFHSRLSASHDPWSKLCPFLDLGNMSILYSNDDGGQATYVSAKSDSNGSNSEHLSMSLGLSVGCSFLGASVTGKYDKDVLKNSDAKKASTRGTYLAGMVAFQHPPRLNDEDIIKIKYEGGIGEFEQFYGDYYVAGCTIGADAAFMCSEGVNSNSTTEGTFHQGRDASANSSFQLAGFDTLSDTHLSLESVNGTGLGALREQAAELALKVDLLNNRVESRLEELKLIEDMRVSATTLDEIFKSGLVIEVILLPVNKLRDVITWVSSKDLI